MPSHTPYPTAFNLDTMRWLPVAVGPGFDYPIDYSIAVVGARRETGRVDMLIKWPPGMYCHLHRHLGDTLSLVLEGEHHVVEDGAEGKVDRVRPVGHFGRTPAGDAHVEYGGPEGSVVFFSIQCSDERVFEVLAADGTVLSTVTIDDLAHGRFAA